MPIYCIARFLVPIIVNPRNYMCCVVQSSMEVSTVVIRVIPPQRVLLSDAPPAFRQTSIRNPAVVDLDEAKVRGRGHR